MRVLSIRSLFRKFFYSVQRWKNWIPEVQRVTIVIPKDAATPYIFHSSWERGLCSIQGNSILPNRKFIRQPWVLCWKLKMAINSAMFVVGRGMRVFLPASAAIMSTELWYLEHRSRVVAGKSRNLIKTYCLAYWAGSLRLYASWCARGQFVISYKKLMWGCCLVTDIRYH